MISKLAQLARRHLMKSEKIQQFIQKYVPDADTGWEWLRLASEAGFSLTDELVFVHPELPTMRPVLEAGQLCWGAEGMNLRAMSVPALLAALELSKDRAKEAADQAKKRKRRTAFEIAMQSSKEIFPGSVGSTISEAEARRRIMEKSAGLQWEETFKP